MDSLFFDVLGAMIGLVTVLLLLSMVVTALVQASQALLRLRGRNLLFGLAAIIAEQADETPERAKELARSILNAEEAPVLRGRINPLSFVGRWMGPQVSWLESAQLKNILSRCTLPLTEEVAKDVLERFSETQEALSKRFQRNMRLWTLAWAIPVAIYFQVSAPALLEDLLTNPELRAQALKMAPDVQARVQAMLGDEVTNAEVSAKALESLAERHPDQRDVLEEAGRLGVDKGNVLAELALALKDSPEREALLKEYGELRNEYHQQELDKALEKAGLEKADLSRLNIEPWREGAAFYIRSGIPRWANWAGVLVTIILLSFGAPFWFNVLGELLSLRDKLKPSTKTEGKQSKD